MRNTCDCIIPFFNEGKRVIDVVKKIVKISNLSKIIIVDDGSSDKSTYQELESKFPKATVIRLKTNSGKSNAIREGLKYTVAQYVLLLDGDLSNIVISEFEHAIDIILTDQNIDMVILRRSKDKTGTAWLRWDIITSGQRVLKRSDLEKVFEQKINGYQLEMAINSYMSINRKKVYWLHSSVQNLHKHRKWGLIEGMKIGIPGLISYAGWKDTIRQSIFFCRNEIH